MSRAEPEQRDETLWSRHREVYEEWLESDDEVLRALAEVAREHHREADR